MKKACGLNDNNYLKFRATIYICQMPTLLIVNGIRFFFYSNEEEEPPHVHFEKGKANGKSWLNPVEIVYWIGFKTQEKRVILRTIADNKDLFKKKWNVYFGKLK